jgi:hypothetical protein
LKPGKGTGKKVAFTTNRIVRGSLGLGNRRHEGKMGSIFARKKPFKYPESIFRLTPYSGMIKKPWEFGFQRAQGKGRLLLTATQATELCRQLEIRQGPGTPSPVDYELYYRREGNDLQFGLKFEFHNILGYQDQNLLLAIPVNSPEHAFLERVFQNQLKELRSKQ